jgi:CheY-like chemotaxis protein
MPIHILIVDDEPDELDAWGALLRRKGHNVQTASTPQQALQKCDEHRFDLVVLDYVIPGMKGLELLARIRKKLPLVRSILISGKLDEKLQEQDIRESIRSEVEVDKYLRKPASNDELLGAITTLFQEKQSARAWDAIAGDLLKGEESSIKKARGAQSKLNKHIKKS